MSIVANINDNWLWRAEDGREAWIMFGGVGAQKDQVCIVTDIHGNGQPDNAVHFPPGMLRMIADEMESRADK